MLRKRGCIRHIFAISEFYGFILLVFMLTGHYSKAKLHFDDYNDLHYLLSKFINYFFWNYMTICRCIFFFWFHFHLWMSLKFLFMGIYGCLKMYIYFHYINSTQSCWIIQSVKCIYYHCRISGLDDMAYSSFNTIYIISFN